MVATIANILKETRSEIITCLKTRGPMGVDEIATALGVSKVCIRRHLDLLGRDNLVAYQVEKHERGRPGHVYYLTEKADFLFPKRYDSFALEVLKQVEFIYGERAVTGVLSKQAEDLLAALKPKLEGLSFDERVETLCALINERGYDISVAKLQDGSYLLRQRNCPIVAVATVHNQVCYEELRVYKELLGTEVQRDCRIAAGAQSCDYRILRPSVR